MGVLSIPQCLHVIHAFACQMQATGTETVLVILGDSWTDNKRDIRNTLVKLLLTPLKPPPSPLSPMARSTCR